MPGVGEYRDWVTVLPRSLAAVDGLGEEVESWPDPPAAGNTHAAKLEAPGGSEAVAAPDRQSAVALRVRFRHQVTLAAVDHVKLVETGEEFAVAGVWRERAGATGWQTVCNIVGPV